MFPAPRLSFACELDPARLVELFADAAVIDDLLALDARVALMCSDFSDERAAVVRRLNAAGVPVTLNPELRASPRPPVSRRLRGPACGWPGGISRLPW
jgi:hypothetical protein